MTKKFSAKRRLLDRLYEDKADCIATINKRESNVLAYDDSDAGNQLMARHKEELTKTRDRLLLIHELIELALEVISESNSTS